MSSQLPPPIRPSLGSTFKRPLTELIVGSAPNGPGLIIAGNVPPELAAYYGNAGINALTEASSRVYSAMGDYKYEIIGDSFSNYTQWSEGLVDNLGVVHEVLEARFDTSDNTMLLFIGRRDNGLVFVTNLEIDADFTFFKNSIEVGGNADIDGSLNVDGNLTVNGPFTFIVNSIEVGGNADIDGSLNVDGDLTVNGAVHAMTDINGIPFKAGFSGKSLISFASMTSFVSAPINFPAPFPAGVTPVMKTNVATNLASTLGWSSRAIAITNTSFEIFVYAPSGGSAQTWSNIPVQWSAEY